MGWSIDHIICHVVKDKILKDRYAGCSYSMADSLSPVIILHRKSLSGKEMVKMAKLFPRHIRVEFQEIKYKGEKTAIYGRGDFIMYGATYARYPVPVVIDKTVKEI